MLVIPCLPDDNIGSTPDYSHLQAFSDNAPLTLQLELFAQVSLAVQQWLREEHYGVWLSTAGQGVAWLHIRLDMKPKYFKHVFSTDEDQHQEQENRF